MTTPGVWLSPPDGAVFGGFVGNAGGQLFYDTQASVPEGSVWASRTSAPGNSSSHDFYPDEVVGLVDDARLFLVDDDPVDLSAISPETVLGVPTPDGVAGFEWEDTAPLAGARFTASGAELLVNTNQRSGALQSLPAAIGYARGAVIPVGDLTLGTPSSPSGFVDLQDVLSGPALSALSWTYFADLSAPASPTTPTTQNIHFDGQWEAALSGPSWLIIDAMSDWERDASHTGAPLIEVQVGLTGMGTPLKLVTVPRYRWLYAGERWPLRQNRRII